MLAIKEGKELIGTEKDLYAVNCAVLQDKAVPSAQLLKKLGCLCIRGALSKSKGSELLNHINDLSKTMKAEVRAGKAPFEERFGGVNCRGLAGDEFGQRQDMWLPVSDSTVRSALEEVVSNLSPLLSNIMGTEAFLHELSCLVADGGAPRQWIHADTIFLPCPQYPDVKMEPLYTFFIALQDVEVLLIFVTEILRYIHPFVHCSQSG